MSERSRELGENDCWGETVTATQSDACLVHPIGEDEVTLGNPEKPRWSIGIGKKDGWDERTKGVTLNRGNRKPGWNLELEALADQGGLTEVTMREDYLKRHITQLVMETLENLNIRREPGQQPQGVGRAAVVDEGTGGTLPLEPAHQAEGAAAGGEDPANPPRQAARTPAPIPNQPRAPQLERETPPLGVKFDGNPQQLGFFVAHVVTYMQEYGRDFPTQGSRVRVVTLALEGAAARWMVTLHNANAPELRDFDRFMMALRRRFEDPLADRKARDRIKVVKQGRRPVAEYTEEFRDLACRVHWPEDILVSCFKDGLSDDLYNACVARGAPNDLHEWYVTAEEAEIDMARNQYRAGRAWKKSSPQWKQEPLKPQTAFSPRSSACFKCGKEGHRAAECRSQPPTRNHPPGESPSKPGRRGKETALRSRETIEVPSPPLFGEETPASEQEESRSFESDPEDEPLVSKPIKPLTLPLRLFIPIQDREISISALVDSGCTRCLISPTLVGRLGINVRKLKTPLAFCQLDGSIAGGEPASLATEPLHIGIGSHEEKLTFIVAPGMEWPLVLGLAWLKKWNPQIHWKQGIIKFQKKVTLAEYPHKGTEGPENRETAMPGQATPIENIPIEYKDLAEVFSEKASDELPPHRATDCAIEILPGAKLPKPKMYSMSPRELVELRTFIEKNLARGFIEPARPKIAAPVLFREKKDGSQRLCIDFRNLNSICVQNMYPLPLMKDMLAHLAKGKIFSKLDLREAYYRVRIKEGDEWKTAFNTPLGCYQFKVLPFGLQGAPAVFMQLINEVLHQHLYKGVLVYLDDILIYTETKAEHVKLVRAVLNKLRTANLYAKLSKCEFHQEKIDYLGYRISHQGVEMDPLKVQAVLDWDPPRTRKQLQSFLGFANFYRQFIPAFAQIALPITKLLKTKGEDNPKPKQPLNWTMECQAAFEKLKRLFSAEPILKHPDTEKPFVIQADASDVAIGAVLLQKNEQDQLQPCAYTSKKLNETEQRWAIWEKEAYAVRWALLTWRHFLEGSKTPFEVWTDHKNLEALKTPRKLSPKQVRWAQYFKRFDFTLKYLPGGKNFLADALSRKPQYNSAKPDVIKPIVQNNQLAAKVVTRSQAKQGTLTDNDTTQTFKQALTTDEWFLNNKSSCLIKDNLAWVGGKLYVPESQRLCLMNRSHDSKLAGHFGFVKTFHLIKRQFWWPSLKKDIESYVASCPICAAAKRRQGKSPGLLQKVAEPSAPWREIAMDFIVELPNSEGNTVIWVVTDLFSKQAHFIPCQKIPTAKSLAKLFLIHIYRLHGAPQRIISDRGAQFTSNFWRAFLGLLGTGQGLSTSFHPCTNGNSEILNSVLEQYLRCFINFQQDNWTELLPFAEVAFNNAVHSSTGFTPFRVATGQDFSPMPELPTEEPTIPSLKEWIDNLQNTWPVVRLALQEAREAFKIQADKKRMEPKPFHIGDRVYLSTKFLKSLQPSKKLGPKFIGPFPITRIINPVAVELLLPKTLRQIHPVFHVSLLKREVTSSLRPPASTPPVPIMIEGEQHFEIKEILDSRIHRGKVQYLVAWKHLPSAQNEWVAEYHVRAPILLRKFHSQYPNKPC